MPQTPLKLLAIDTATATCGVALTEDGRLVADARLHRPNVHNEKLVGLIQWLFNQADWRFEDLSGIAVSIGPGSFTGLRIGLSVAKGLALAVDRPVVPVNTLDALAFSVTALDATVCVVIRARKGEYYFAQYTKSGTELRRHGEYTILDHAAVQARLPNQSVLVAQPPELFQEFAAEGIVGLPESQAVSSAAAVGELATRRFPEASQEDVAALEPFYLKEFEAKRKVYEFAG